MKKITDAINGVELVIYSSLDFISMVVGLFRLRTKMEMFMSILLGKRERVVCKIFSAVVNCKKINVNLIL